MLWSGVAGVRRFQLREKRKCRGSRLRHNTGDLTSAQLQEAGTEKKKKVIASHRQILTTKRHAHH